MYSKSIPAADPGLRGEGVVLFCLPCGFSSSCDFFFFTKISGGGGGGCPPPPPQDEAFFFVLAFRICLPNWSVTSFLRGGPPPMKNPGSAPGTHEHIKANIKTLTESD